MPGRANTFQSYLDGLDGGGSGSLFGAANRSRGGIGVPYYRAHREFDDAFDRIYTPNAVPDQAFRADQETRTKLYVDYLKESDPKKRAQLYRLYNQQSLRTARDSGAGSTRAALRDRNVSSTATVRNITDQFLPAPLSLEFAHDSRFRRRVCVRDPGRDPRPGHPFDQASGRPIGLQQLVGGPPLIGFPLVPAGHFGSRAALWPLPETVVGNAFSRSPLVNAPFSRMIDSVLVRYSRLTRWDFFWSDFVKHFTRRSPDEADRSVATIDGHRIHADLPVHPGGDHDRGGDAGGQCPAWAQAGNGGQADAL